MNHFLISLYEHLSLSSNPFFPGINNFPSLSISQFTVCLLLTWLQLCLQLITHCSIQYINTLWPLYRCCYSESQRRKGSYHLNLSPSRPSAILYPQEQQLTDMLKVAKDSALSDEEPGTLTYRVTRRVDSEGKLLPIFVLVVCFSLTTNFASVLVHDQSAHDSLL